MNKLRAEHLQVLKQQNEDNKAAQAKIATELIASHDVALSQKEDQHEAALKVLIYLFTNDFSIECDHVCDLLSRFEITIFAGTRVCDRLCVWKRRLSWLQR